MSASNRPQTPPTTILIVLDGWGHNESTEHNAIAAARTPNWDRLWSEAPHSLISGSGEDVGLPAGQMGNSEVGHMNLGAGRIVYQELTRIDKAIKTGSFNDNPALTAACDKARDSDSTLHLMGLLSPGGVHSHEQHIFAAVDLAAARGVKQVCLHAFLDGRDTPPRSAGPSLERAEAKLAEHGYRPIASIIGRYYAMDRDNRWDRVEQAYQLLTAGDSDYEADSAGAALEAAYARDENDEFVKATCIPAADGSRGIIRDNDVVIFMNFRADRARQISRALLHDDFDGFKRRQRPQLADFVTLTKYADDIKTSCAYAPEDLHNSFGEYLAALGKKQLRLAETEKYAHVTFFFSGGREEPFDGEERILVPSPKVATYDLQPEMSAPEVTDKLVEAIGSGRYDAIICNYANGDMVGHSGIFDAAVKAVECVDQCLGRILDALKVSGSQCLITADHGNVERMQDDSTGQAHTAHTTEPVPLVYAGPRQLRLDDGILSDIAPTLLRLMDLEVPPEMTGRNLAQIDEPARRTA
jgi:2,3-bisphosphoglycerate-independent phosphoglycerate mutase